MPIPEYNLLEARQMTILNQLSELKAQVEHLCISIKVADIEKSSVNNATALLDQKPVAAEIIVNANPASPPYFILALQRIWKDTNFNVEVYHHSTSVNAATKAFDEKLLSKANANAVHTIDLKLIWKNVQDVQLIAKVYDYPLEGEANILRYLTRLIESYSYESSKSSLEINTIDSILDLCLRLSFEEPRNINAVTAKFSKYLDKNPWLLNSTDPSIVDVAVWSALKRLGPNKVPQNIKNWFDLCEKTFLSL